MICENKIIEHQWLPDWCYGSSEKEALKNSSIYWNDDMYAVEEKVIDTFFFRQAPSIKAMEDF